MKAEPERLPKDARARNREKTREELELAILRVKNKGVKMSISAVAEEAGITPGLIHNTYPDVAEKIRRIVGRTFRQQRDQKDAELTSAHNTILELRKELADAKRDIEKLASINETLRDELVNLTLAMDANVSVLHAARKS